METESKIKTPGVIQASVDNEKTDTMASDLSSTSSRDEIRESERLSPMIGKQKKWKIPTKAFTTSSKISSDNIVPKKKYTPSKKDSFDPATFDYSSPYAVYNKPVTRRISSTSKESIPRRKRQLVSTSAKVFDKATYHSPYGEFCISRTGRAGRGYGRKIQTQPSFDKHFFLVAKESAVRRSSVRMDEILGPNSAEIDLDFEEELELAEDFKEAVMIVNDKKPFTVGMEKLYRAPHTVSRTRNPNPNRMNSPMKGSHNNYFLGRTQGSVSTEGSTCPSEERKNVLFSEELSDKDSDGIESDGEDDEEDDTLEGALAAPATSVAVPSA